MEAFVGSVWTWFVVAEPAEAWLLSLSDEAIACLTQTEASEF